MAAAVAVGSAASAHSAAGHHSPHFLVVVLALAVSVPICVQLSGVALSRRRLAGAVLSSQAVLHALFALFPAAAVGSSGLSSGSHSHHGGEARTSLSSGSDVPDPAAFGGAGDTSAHLLVMQADPTMVLAHLLAALSAFSLLRFGETLIQAIVDRLSIAPALMLLDFGPPAHTLPARIASAVGTEQDISSAWLHAGPRTLRGPPVLVKQTHTPHINVTEEKDFTMHTTTNSSAVLRFGTASLMAAALGVAASAPAFAHDTLIDSNPEADQVLDESPDEVVLEFSGNGLTTGESITNEIVILDSEEVDWASEESAEVDGSIMTTDIPEPLPNGEYEVRYRVVYSDGHNEELGFTFEVDAPLAEGEEGAALGESSESDTSATEPAPTEEAQDDDAALEAAQNEDASGQWGGPLFWAALGAALAGVALVAWFAVRRRGAAGAQGR